MQRIAGTSAQQDFFDRWVRREARAKWSGDGIRAIREAEAPAPPGERLIPLETFPGYVACLCTHSAARVAPVRTFVLREQTTQIVSST